MSPEISIPLLTFHLYLLSLRRTFTRTSSNAITPRLQIYSEQDNDQDRPSIILTWLDARCNPVREIKLSVEEAKFESDGSFRISAGVKESCKRDFSSLCIISAVHELPYTNHAARGEIRKPPKRDQSFWSGPYKAKAYPHVLFAMNWARIRSMVFAPDGPRATWESDERLIAFPVLILRND